MSIAKGAFTATKEHDCQPPSMLLRTEPVYEMQRKYRWWPFSQQVKVQTGTKEVWHDQNVTWQCPVCKSTWRWRIGSFYYHIYGHPQWECSDRKTKKVSSNSVEALDKLDPWL